MKYIYLILTRTCTFTSRMIRCFTGDRYTHAAIALEEDMHTMYSFARKYASLPLPAGFMEEHPDGKFYRHQGNIPCIVLKKSIGTRQYYKLKNIIYGMKCRAGEYRYSLIGLLLCRLGIALEIPGHYFCSQFVARLLCDSGIADLPKSPSLMHPADFLGINGFETVWDGGMSDWVSRLNQYA